MISINSIQLNYPLIIDQLCRYGINPCRTKSQYLQFLLKKVYEYSIFTVQFEVLKRCDDSVYIQKIIHTVYVQKFSLKLSRKTGGNVILYDKIMLGQGVDGIVLRLFKRCDDPVYIQKLYINVQKLYIKFIQKTSSVQEKGHFYLFSVQVMQKTTSLNKYKKHTMGHT